MSNRKLDFPGLYMKATYDCAQLKVQCDDLTEEISRLRDENKMLRERLDDIWQGLQTVCGDVRAAIRESGE